MDFLTAALAILALLGLVAGIAGYESRDGFTTSDDRGSVSYTHLTLPTILRV